MEQNDLEKLVGPEDLSTGGHSAALTQWESVQSQAHETKVSKRCSRKET